jgi:hypothetical protein
MNRKFALILVVFLVVAITSATSHLAVGRLGIRTHWGTHKSYGSKYSKTAAVLHSSSPGYDAIDWDQVSELLGGQIESWATPGSSPTEWEASVPRAPKGMPFFVAISAFDMNEDFLCDMRAEMVPLTRAVRDLRQVDADWHLSQRVLSQYPIMLARQIFPTVGRSDGVLVGIRANLERIAGRQVEAGEAPKFAPSGKSAIDERITDWPQARLERRLLLMLAETGRQSFNGPKKLALLRLLQADQGGHALLLIVVPNSPFYRQSILGRDGLKGFEEELSELHLVVPDLPIVRLDQLSTLQDNEYYYDHVHLNMFGQQIATEAFLDQFKTISSRSDWPVARAANSR